MEQQGTQQNVWSGHSSWLGAPYTRYIVVTPTLPSIVLLLCSCSTHRYLYGIWYKVPCTLHRLPVSYIASCH